MKEKHNYLMTSIWYKDKIKDPYQVIASAFDAADVKFYRRLIKGVLLAAQSNRIYRKRDPGDLIFEFKMLESLINAAYLLNREKKESPINVGSHNLLNKNLYCGNHAGSSEWDSFPRSLSEKEYKNPYLVFKSFFKYRSLEEWKKELEDILTYALVKSDEGLELDLLSTYFHLTKLIEAAHLIDVREITHVGGYIKNRF